MEQNSIKDSLIKFERLSNNDEYYTKVFKKTEKIVSAVFYVLSHIPVTDSTRLYHENLTKKTFALHEAASATLAAYTHDAAGSLHNLKQALVILESTLYVFEGARLLSGEVILPLVDETDQVLRYLRHHLSEDNHTISLARQVSNPVAPSKRPTLPRRSRPNIPKNDMSSDAILVYSELSDRTTRIKTVLEAKPEATIKDLTDIITDVSAKTIQRDLNTMIETGEVIRQGERRWSKYSLS